MLQILLVLQKGLTCFWQSMTTLVRIVVFSGKTSQLPKVEKDKSVVILANGPSLTRMISKHETFLDGKDCACVNFFPTTDYYQDVKPRFIILSAPDIWRETNESFRILAENLFTSMRDKTVWPAVFFIPCEAKKKRKWQDILSTNKNITICFYNNTPAEGWRWFRHAIFRSMAAMPRPQNILIPSIHLSLLMGYKTIYLWGADHSWLKELSVDDDNNALVNQKHFYDEQTSKPDTMHKNGSGQRKLHEILYKLMKSFESYFTLRDFADSMNARVINNTPDSFIDAFDKERLD